MNGEDRVAGTARELKLHVAIDGPAGAGKSTVGRAIAHRLECAYLDTGLMYRALTRCALCAGVDPRDSAAVGRLADNMAFALQEDDGNWHLLLNGELLPETGLRSRDVEDTVSDVSRHPNARAILVDQQRALATERCMVMLGRDIGTVVLPNAPVKLFVTASPEVRAHRRFLDRTAEGLGSTEERTLLEIRSRDDLDSTRAVSPLRIAPDAVIIDTTNMEIEEAVDAGMAHTLDAMTSVLGAAGG